MASAWHRPGPSHMIAVIIATAVGQRKILRRKGKSKQEEDHMQSRGCMVWAASASTALRKTPAKTLVYRNLSHAPEARSMLDFIKPARCARDSPFFSLFIHLVFVE